MLTFTVPGEPVAKGRAKVSTINGHVSLRTPTKTVRYESTVALFSSRAMGSRDLFAGAVSLVVTAVFTIPKSWSQKRRAQNLVTPEFVVKRPDLDNIIKSLCDGMNGVVWVDDCQVGLTTGSKVYGEHPRVDVVVDVLS